MIVRIPKISCGSHCSKLLTILVFCAAALVIACQTEPNVVTIPTTDDSETVDTETHYYVLNEDSVVVDWHYDTSDGTGGADEACYQRSGKSGPVVWCDNPSLIAQTCQAYESQCCCRQSCEPTLCSAADGGDVPCNYLDLANPIGYCQLPEDEQPVAYPCTDNCTPRSECENVAVDGSCLDLDASNNGLCLLYDMDTEVKKCCQKRCEMTFCDDTHMCVPLYGEKGVSQADGGACVPIAN